MLTAPCSPPPVHPSAQPAFVPLPCARGDLAKSPSADLRGPSFCIADQRSGEAKPLAHGPPWSSEGLTRGVRGMVLPCRSPASVMGQSLCTSESSLLQVIRDTRPGSCVQTSLICSAPRRPHQPSLRSGPLALEGTPKAVRLTAQFHNGRGPTVHWGRVSSLLSGPGGS